MKEQQTASITLDMLYVSSLEFAKEETPFPFLFEAESMLHNVVYLYGTTAPILPHPDVERLERVMFMFGEAANIARKIREHAPGDIDLQENGFRVKREERFSSFLTQLRNLLSVSSTLEVVDAVRNWSMSPEVLSEIAVRIVALEKYLELETEADSLRQALIEVNRQIEEEDFPYDRTLDDALVDRKKYRREIARLEAKQEKHKKEASLR
jgi:hypothetical protein